MSSQIVVDERTGHVSIRRVAAMKMPALALAVVRLTAPPTGYQWVSGNPGFLPISGRSWKPSWVAGMQWTIVKAGRTTWLAVRPVSGGTVSYFYAAPAKITSRFSPVGRIGFGAVDVSAVASSISAADTYLASGEYDNAVQAYRAAGQAAVTLSKQYSLTMPAGFGTGGGGDLNAQLQAINDANDNPGTTASQSDAQNAQSLANQINTALVAAANAQGVTPGGGQANTDPLLQATQALLTYFQSNAPSTSAVSIVGVFQASWNSAGGAALSVDSKYGPATQAAFQAAITAYGLSGSAPTNAFGTAPPAPPKPPPNITPPVPGGGGSNSLVVWWESLPLWQQVLLGGAAAGGTYLAGKAVLKKGYHKKAAGHARRLGTGLKHHGRRLVHRLHPRRA